MKISFNTHDQVKVTLTAVGADIYNKTLLLSESKKEGDVLETQLCALMHTFGVAAYTPSYDLFPFKEGIIELVL
jgi:hypothetical protein